MVKTISEGLVNNLRNCSIENESIFNDENKYLLFALTEEAAKHLEGLLITYGEEMWRHREGDCYAYRRARQIDAYIKMYYYELRGGQYEFVPMVNPFFECDFDAIEAQQITAHGEFNYLSFNGSFGYFEYGDAKKTRNISLAESTQLDEEYYDCIKEEYYEGNEDWYCEGSGQFYENRMEVECYGWGGDY